MLLVNLIKKMTKNNTVDHLILPGKKIRWMEQETTNSRTSSGVYTTQKKQKTTTIDAKNFASKQPFNQYTLIQQSFHKQKNPPLLSRVEDGLRPYRLSTKPSGDIMYKILPRWVTVETTKPLSPMGEYD